MGNSITLIPVKKEGANPHSLTGSLQKNGMNRFPGCVVTIPPHREVDGSFRTGMDPNALYIKQMIQAGKVEEAQLETERVTELRDRLQLITGLDLGPRSSYFTQMGRGSENDLHIGKFAKLRDDAMVFDFADPQQEIMAAWLRVHPVVAPSWEDYRRAPKPYMMYYVSNPTAEEEIKYDEKKKVNRAIVELDKMTPPTMRRVARLLDLPVHEDTPERNVYNLLDTFIKQGEIKNKGSIYHGKRAIFVFNEILDTKEDLLVVKDLVKQALQQGVYRKTKGVIFEGENRIADSETEMVKDLLADTQNRISLEKKVKSKKVVNGGE